MNWTFFFFTIQKKRKEGQRYDIVGIFFFRAPFHGPKSWCRLRLKVPSESACLIYMVMTCQRPRERCTAAKSSPSTKRGRLHEWQSRWEAREKLLWRRRRHGVSKSARQLGSANWLHILNTRQEMLHWKMDFPRRRIATVLSVCSWPLGTWDILNALICGTLSGVCKSFHWDQRAFLVSVSNRTACSQCAVAGRCNKSMQLVVSVLALNASHDI